MENIDLAKIAELAYLEIQESEKEKLTQKLKQVIEYVGKIKELDFSVTSKENLEPTSALKPKIAEPKIAEPAIVEPVRLRADKPQKTQIDITTLSNSTENGCFKVPKVIKNFEN